VQRDPPDAEARPLTFLLAALWTLGAGVLLGAVIALIDAVHPGAFVDVVTVAGCKLLAYSVVLFGVLFVHAPASSIRHLLALRRPPTVLVLLGAVVGAGLAPGAMWLDGALARRFPPSQVELDAYARVFDVPTVGKKVAVLLALVLVMPVCDELFFRGALFTPLKRGRRAESVILATAAYDTLLGGAQPRELASVLVTALAFSWLRAATGGVLPSVAARVAFFAVQVVPLVVLGGDLALSPLVTAGGLVAAAAALLAVAAAGQRSAAVSAARSADG
jgi:hypothetical protein